MKVLAYQQQGSHRRRRWFRFFRAITILMLIGASLGMGLLAGLFASVSALLPTGDELSDIRPPAPTRILASDGTLLAKVFSENRENVPIDRMKHIIPATLAIEDVRFYSHPGIDPRGIMRALITNIAAGDTKEGASTITQQLARNLYLTRQKIITRKLQEMVLALEIERRYAKNEILEAYLNQAYYGANRHGVQSWGCQVASQNYFNKDVEDLTIAEAALLAGLPKNPRDYNPYRYPEAAIKRRNTVLRIMLNSAFISRAQYDEAIDTPISLAPERKLKETADFHAPYFVDFILPHELKRVFGQDWLDLVYRYGINVHTSLDPRMQKVAEDVVTRKVKENKFRRIDDGALVCIDFRTGLIKAMVGGTNFRKDQYNIVTQGRRQPGSSFKPFVYTTALLRGYTPKTIIHDSPGRYPSGTDQIWSPKNSDGRFLGPLPLEKALWLSRNAAAAAVANDVGIKPIIDIAYRMGIKHPLEPYLSTSLGASVVAPLEICSAYGTLANAGVHHPPTAITRITTADGDLLYEYRPLAKRALPADIANTMRKIMRGAVERGTGRAARCPFPVSGKTGTTNSYRDAWFIGYTDDLVTAVWVGNRQNQPMNRTYGGTVPAPIWREFMMVAHPIMAAEHKTQEEYLVRINSLPDATNIDRTPTEYVLKMRGKRAEDTPEESPVEETVNASETYQVTICMETGDRATPWCPETMVVTYMKGRQPSPPSRRCSAHTNAAGVPTANGQEGGGTSEQGGVLISVCAETGKIASDRCPRVLLRRFTDDPPTETCPLHGTH
jgi:penicillin-binding protein 1A